MKQTDQTLLEQMRITDLDIESRKNLLSFTQFDVLAMISAKKSIEMNIDSLVDEFYTTQTSVPEIALLIGDADTLMRLRNAQRRYVLDLFSGIYDLEYVNNRLRIGLVHKRIGVEPKLYLSAVHTLQALLHRKITVLFQNETERDAIHIALDKLFLFDVTLVFETYIRSMVSEIESAKDKAEQYAYIMEEKVKERTKQLEDMSRTDALTGLQNIRYFKESVVQALRSAQRRGEPLSLIYFDINDFKLINDNQGHQGGDETLRFVANAIRSIARIDDGCFRYGGDEFCIILNNCLATEAQTRFVDGLNQKLKAAPYTVSISCGISQSGPDDFIDAELLIQQADKKMYLAKKATKHNSEPDKEPKR